MVFALTHDLLDLTLEELFAPERLFPGEPVVLKSSPERMPRCHNRTKREPSEWQKERKRIIAEFWADWAARRRLKGLPVP